MVLMPMTIETVSTSRRVRRESVVIIDAASVVCYWGGGGGGDGLAGRRAFSSTPLTFFRTPVDVCRRGSGHCRRRRRLRLRLSSIVYESRAAAAGRLFQVSRFFPFVLCPVSLIAHWLLRLSPLLQLLSLLRRRRVFVRVLMRRRFFAHPGSPDFATFGARAFVDDASGSILVFVPLVQLVQQLLQLFLLRSVPLLVLLVVVDLGPDGSDRV